MRLLTPSDNSRCTFVEVVSLRLNDPFSVLQLGPVHDHNYTWKKLENFQDVFIWDITVDQFQSQQESVVEFGTPLPNLQYQMQGCHVRFFQLKSVDLVFLEPAEELHKGVINHLIFFPVYFKSFYLILEFIFVFLLELSFPELTLQHIHAAKVRLHTPEILLRQSPFQKSLLHLLLEFLFLVLHRCNPDSRQVQYNSQVQIILKPTLHMDFQNNFTCPLCLQLAKEAVESACCTKIYCQQCIEKSFKRFGQCPCCRSKTMTYHPSRIARKVISEIKVPCLFCETQVEFGQMDNHLDKCPKKKINCKLCKMPFQQADLPKHTATEHQPEAKQYLIKYINELNKAKNSKAEGLKVNIYNHNNYFKPIQNRLGLKATLGITSKYYCKGSLLGKCSCCNGVCGPDNGENCDACMELDVKRWCLAKTYLINPSGYVCQVLRLQGAPIVTCFRITDVQKPGLFSKSESVVTCKPGLPCTSCAQVQNSIKLNRYVGLY